MSLNKFSVTLGLAVFISSGVLVSAQFSSLQISPTIDDNSSPFNFNYESKPYAPTPRYRLPNHVVPYHYTLKQRPILDVMPDFEQFDAPSEVTILVTCVTSTINITLHRYPQAITIDTDGVQVTPISGEPAIPIVSHDFINATDFYIITVATPLQQGADYKIFIPFTTVVDIHSPFGLSGADYIDPDVSGTSYMSVTTLEPHYARRVFPCFDEPNLKATFDIIIGRTAAYQSLAHTAINETVQDGDWFWDHYERTVIMPTYLICMIVVSTNYEAAIAPPGHYAKDVKAWANKRTIEIGGGDFAAETSAKSLDYFEKTYKFNYSLSKLDSITVPGFPAGALENWGLNTYRENVLIWLGGENGEAQKKSSASTISHEVSHQWFGNLVSCIFWDQIWLNEGLANYMAYKGVAATNPEFEPEEAFPAESVQAAMRVDQQRNSHPVKFAEMPDDWMNIFDTISYSKGGALLRMAQGFLTQEIIDNGFIHYLEKMQYKGADQDDLFASLDAAASEAPVNPLPVDLTVKKILDTWTLQPGYPLVRVSKAGTTRIFISQERFFRFDENLETDFWHIPVKIVSESSPTATLTPNLWIRQSDILLSHADGIDTTKWLILNPDASGYYRVWYDSDLLDLIRTQLESNPKLISPGSRSQLFDDYWHFAIAGYDHINASISLTKYMDKEDSFVVWSSVFTNLRPTYNMLSGSPRFQTLSEYLVPKLESALDIIGLEQGSDDIGVAVILRSLLVDWACGLGSLKCITEAQRVFQLWTSPTDPIPVPVDLQPVYFCAASASLSKENGFDFILSEYQKDATREGVKARLLAALACTTDVTLLSTLAEMAFDVNEIRPGDRNTLLQRIANNPLGRDMMYTFAKENLEVAERGAGVFAAVVSALSAHWHSNAELTDLTDFIEDHGDDFIGNEEVLRSLQTTRANIQANIDWMKLAGDQIVEWMADNTI